MTTLPFSPAAQRNATPITEILSDVLIEDDMVLEIGAGTGQHAVHMAKAFPNVRWLATDRAENLSAISARIEHAGCSNTPSPQELDVLADTWPPVSPTVVYTANTFHIMPPKAWPILLRRAFELLPEGGRVVIYGPFRARGRELEPSNMRFEQLLQREVPHRGIRVQEDVIEFAEELGFRLRANHAMPANNRCLVFVRSV